MEGKHKNLRVREEEKENDSRPRLLVDSASPDDRPLGPCLPVHHGAREFVLPAVVYLFSRARQDFSWPEIDPETRERVSGTSQLAAWEINHEEKRGMVYSRPASRGRPTRNGQVSRWWRRPDLEE